MTVPVAFTLLCASITTCGADMEIAKRGVGSAYSIGVRRDAPANERYAAEEFAKGVLQLTGVNLATVVGKAPDKAKACRVQSRSECDDQEG